MTVWLVLEYLFWEFSLLTWGSWLASVVLRVEAVEGGEEGEPGGDVRFVTLALLFNMMSACAAGSVVSFARCNGRWSYAALAVLALLVVWRRGQGVSRSLARLREAAGRAAGSVPLAPRLLIATLGLALLWVFLRPTVEWDSIKQISTMQSWLANRTNPYDSTWNYVVFTELGYMPAMAILRDDRFFWLVSIKPMLLLGLSLYQFGLTQRLSKTMAALAAVNLLAMMHVLPLGLPTLKNDMTHACGLVLFALGGMRILRGTFDREAGVLLAAAISLMTVKYSGLLEAAAGVGLLGALAWRDLIRHRTRVIRWAGAAALAAFLVSGHYYAHNLWTFGNPLYPFELKVASVELPGRMDLSGTSILDHLKEPALWRAFFPTGRISPAGLWFPLTMACCLVVLPAAMIRRGFEALRGERSRARDVFVMGLAVAMWMIYFRSFYSAGRKPDDLMYVNPDTLFSLRYVEGAIGLGEVILLGMLAARGFRSLAYAMILTSLASRTWIALCEVWPPLESPEPLVILVGAGALSVMAALAVGRVRNPKVRRGVAWTVATLAAGVLVPWHYNLQRERNWPVAFRPIWEVTRQTSRRSIFFVTGPDGPQPILYHYHVIGGRFDRGFFPVKEEQIARTDRPVRGYVVRVSDFYHHRLDDPAARSALRDFEVRMEQIGYEKVASNPFCTMLRPAVDGRVASRRDRAVIR